jgi:Flp pilus assembly protein TadD
MKRASQLAAIAITILTMAACDTGGFGTSKLRLPKDSPFAPAVDPSGQTVDQLDVGHRLMNAGQFELALKAFTRAAAQQGLTADTLSALGSANLGLGRLGQSEALLRDAVKADETRPESWNNLGVVLMEQGKTAEAAQIFRKAYALDDGQSDSVRDNLRLALAKLENPLYADPQQQEYKLVQRGNGNYLIRKTP